MKPALEAMQTMERGSPHSLSLEDRKRRPADDFRKLCREIGVEPVVIGGLAVNHPGFMRFTDDPDVPVSKDDAARLFRRLKETPGRRRHAEGFRSSEPGVGLDIRVEGARTSPRWDEVFPGPREIRRLRINPLPVVALPELIALKVKSGRAKDDADVVELLKRRPSRIRSVSASAARRRLAGLVDRAREELARR
jgi:hypothetical protein